jgi:hypothetical protein
MISGIGLVPLWPEECVEDFGRMLGCYMIPHASSSEELDMRSPAHSLLVIDFTWFE